MTREEAIEQLQNCKDLIKQDGQDYLDERDIPLLNMAIEALMHDRKNMNKTDAAEILQKYVFDDGECIAQDMKDYNEALKMAIEALTDSINCVKCKHYYETEDDTDVHGHCRMDTAHTELVLCKDCRYFKKIVERSDSGLCYRDLVASAWKENGYCSRGERREP